MSATANNLFLQRLRRDLPAFPDEVLEEWIAPCARRNGWPPVGPTWYNILLGRSIVTWARMRWTQEDRPLEWWNLAPDSAMLIRDLIDAHVNGNLFIAARYPPNGRQRVQSALQYLIAHGVMPKRIAVGELDGLLGLADGCHRVTAYFAYRNMRADPRTLAALPIMAAHVKPRQPMWVARV